jgi:hypothetical protein
LLNVERQNVHCSRIKFYHDASLGVSVELKAYLQYQENTLYVVEEFLELKKVQSGIQVLVKWMGFESAENSWEPIETLVEDAPDLLRDFLTTTSSVLAPDVLSLL